MIVSNVSIGLSKWNVEFNALFKILFYKPLIAQCWKLSSALGRRSQMTALKWDRAERS